MSAPATKRQEKGRRRTALNASDHNGSGDEKVDVNNTTNSADTANTTLAIPPTTNTFAFGSFASLRPMTSINFVSAAVRQPPAAISSISSSKPKQKQKLRRIKRKSRNYEVASRSRSRSRTRTHVRVRHVAEGVEIANFGDHDQEQEQYETTTNDDDEEETSQQVVYSIAAGRFQGGEPPNTVPKAPDDYDRSSDTPTIGMFYHGRFGGLVYPPPAPIVPAFPCRTDLNCTEHDRRCDSHKYVLFVRLLVLGEKVEWTYRKTGFHFTIPFPCVPLCWLWLKEQITRLIGLPVADQKSILIAGRRIDQYQNYDRDSSLMYQSTIFVMIDVPPATIDHESTL